MQGQNKFCVSFFPWLCWNPVTEAVLFQRVHLLRWSKGRQLGQQLRTHILKCMKELESQLGMACGFETWELCCLWHDSSNKATPPNLPKQRDLSFKPSHTPDRWPPPTPSTVVTITRFYRPTMSSGVLVRHFRTIGHFLNAPFSFAYLISCAQKVKQSYYPPVYLMPICHTCLSEFMPDVFLFSFSKNHSWFCHWVLAYLLVFGGCKMEKKKKHILCMPSVLTTHLSVYL